MMDQFKNYFLLFLIFPLININSISAGSIEIIQKIGSQCPIGYFTTGGFCKPYKNNRRKALINKDRNICPVGYFSSAKFYCVSHQKF